MASRVSLGSVLLGVIGVTVVVGLVPAGIAIDRHLTQSLLARARADLEVAPALLADRNAAYSDALMMHAKELAHAPGLAVAVARGDRAAVLASIEAVRASLGAGVPLVVGAIATVNMGPTPDPPLLEATRRGEMPVRLGTDGTIIRNVALAPLLHDGRWVGAAGVAIPLDDEEAIGLKGLSRSDVIVAPAIGDSVSAATLAPDLARALVASLRSGPQGTGAREVEVAGSRYLAVSTALADAGWAIFVRSIDQELELIPALRRTAAISATGAVLLALLLGAWMAMRVARPVRQLAAAASAMREGSFDVELPHSRVAEVHAMAQRFEEMRDALRQRLADLRRSNEDLQQHSERLQALQSDLMQRERLAVAGRLVAQLAHEIRNPVAALRNCLEVVRRRVAHDPEGVQFADLAIDELLRMHELAEQMLDVSRPRSPVVARCSPVRVARDVVRLVTAGIPDDELLVVVTGDATLHVPMAGDALKQVLLNLVQNAREAVRPTGSPRGTRVTVEVAGDDNGIAILVDDNGPGVAPEHRDRIFDPFFSTKAALHGVGLGLFVAEGLVRGAGGRLSIGDAPEGGARFTLHLPSAGEGAPDGLAAAPTGERETP